MSEDAKRITDGLKKAIDAEIDGYHFYMMAARSCGDPKGKDVFAQLAQDEMEHVRFLRLQYNSFLDHQAPDRSAKLPRRRDLDSASPIFSDQIRSRLGDAHFEMSALSIGIQLELSAVNFYQERSAEASDETVKQFYDELAQWESGHYHALLKQQAELKEDYWAAGGFSPF